MLLASACVHAQYFSLTCFFYFPSDFIAFNLKSLVELGTKTVPFTVYENNTAIEGLLTYNLCSEVAVPQKCQDSGLASHAYFISKEGTTCYNLISAESVQNTAQFIDSSSTDAMTKGFSITRPPKAFSFILKCNPDAITPQYKAENNSYAIESKDACGYVNEAARMFMESKIIVSVTLIIFGIILTFFGGYKWNHLVGTLGFAISFASTFFIFWTIVSFEPETWSYVLVGVLAIIAGFFGSYIFRVFSDLAYFAFGFIAGMALVRNLFFVFQFHWNDVSLPVGLRVQLLSGRHHPRLRVLRPPQKNHSAHHRVVRIIHTFLRLRVLPESPGQYFRYL
jgi:hypothetical protein